MCAAQQALQKSGIMGRQFKKDLRSGLGSDSEASPKVGAKKKFAQLHVGRVENAR